MEKEYDDAHIHAAPDSDSELPVTLDALMEKIKERHHALKKILNYLNNEGSEKKGESANDTSKVNEGRSDD